MLAVRCLRLGMLFGAMCLVSCSWITSTMAADKEPAMPKKIYPTLGKLATALPTGSRLSRF